MVNLPLGQLDKQNARRNRATKNSAFYDNQGRMAPVWINFSSAKKQPILDILRIDWTALKAAWFHQKSDGISAGRPDRVREPGYRIF